MDQFEKFENQLISSYESTLAVEAREICKEVESLLENDYKFLIEKAEIYSNFCLSFRKDSLDKDLFIKCKKLKYDISNLRSIKYNLDSISDTRKNQKKSLKES